MFNVKFDFMARIAECPDSGLPAIDFRRKHGLPAGSTQLEAVKWEAESEPFVRRFATLADNAGDIALIGGSHNWNDFDAVSFHSSREVRACFHRESFDGINVPLELVRPFINGTASENDAISLFASIMDQAAAIRQAAEQSKADELRLKDEEKAAREALEQSKITRLRSWTTDHGSELARLRMQEGYGTWVAVAREEYANLVAKKVAAGLAESEAEEGVEYEMEAVKSPSVPEILALRQSRKLASGYPDCTVNLVRVTADDDREPVNELEVTVGGLPGKDERRYFTIG